MKLVNLIRTGFDRLLEAVVVLLVLALALLVITGFVTRALGSPLSWYDEVASVGLAWLTYYGSVLAASKGAHIACPSIVNLFPTSLRVAAVLFAEACVIGFFILLAWTGLQVVWILEGSTLISLPEVSLQLTQSVIPIASILFILAELLRLPEVLAKARSGGFIDHELEDVLPASRTVPN